jgi:hypothetical protein
MSTIYEIKELAVPQTPLMLFDCTLTDGTVEHWSTHKCTVGSTSYEARVLKHNVFEIQAASDYGVDGIPRISLTMANADGHFSQLERATGLKGAKLATRFVFYDLQGDSAVTEAIILFNGVCNPPDEVTESQFRITAMNRMNMQRVLMPQVRIQRRCPWDFPTTAAQRTEAFDGGTQGKYSRYYRCGYSPDVSGGAGSLLSGAPYTSCTFTRDACTARGMFNNFGGIEFVPAVIQVRTYGAASSHESTVTANESRYNDFVPVVYGTAWYTPPVVFARNDGNLTRMEVLLGIGEIQGVVTLLANDVEIPVGASGTNMTGTGWYNVPTLGTRSGGFNLDFLNSDGTPAGDAYGSMAYASVVVPSKISSGTSLATIKVLIQGVKIPVYDSNAAYVGEQFSNNPAWILWDVLRRSGWAESELDVASFVTAAAYCDETIAAEDNYGNAISLPRFQCNVVLRKRRSAGDLIRGIRMAARLMLTYDADGKVQLLVENTLALQQPAKPVGTNSTETLNGGWPAYEFDDGTYGFSGILRGSTGEPAIKLWGRSSADTGNRFGIEFQDALNEYQQDSYSIVDADDVAKAGQEITGTLTALGLPNFDQAARILKFNLDKSIRGNTYVEFDTSVRAVGLRPGSIITLTYLREGFDRQPFRVLKIAPGSNYGTARITAQIHDDAWYLDTNGQTTASSGTGNSTGTGLGVPKPLVGTVVDANGDVQLGMSDTTETEADGSVKVSLSVSFTVPRTPASSGPGKPLLDLTPVIGTGGTLSGARTLYYAVTAVDASEEEGAMSFVVRATLPVGSGQCVKLTGLRWASKTSTFSVYRGSSPAQLLRIAAAQPLSDTFTDNGASPDLTAAPDPNFDHVNFYWRLEHQPEVAATIHTTTTIGNATLEMAENEYRGDMVRVTRGTGVGQERAVTSNTATVLTIAQKWDLEPDATSYFTVSDAAWQSGAVSTVSPAAFEIPNRPGEIVQVCGRTANINDVECSAELSPVSRWQINGSGTTDTGVAPKPAFGGHLLNGGGGVEITGVSFTDLTNTRTITSGTLTLYYWNELQGAESHSLNAAIAAGDTSLSLNVVGGGVSGTILQIDAELIQVENSLNSGLTYQVTRGVHGTTAAAHTSGCSVYHLDSKTVVMPFPEDFFGSAYGGSWGYPLAIPDVKIASATLFVTNRYGNSTLGYSNMVQTTDVGMRTCSGGQYSLQVDGFLALDASATPPLTIDATHVARDVYATLGTAADAEVKVAVKKNSATYCTLTIAAGATISAGVNGFGLPVLTSGEQLTLSILSVGSTAPGSELTVMIRL